MPEINSQVLSEWISHIIRLNDKEIGDISYIFCSDQYLLEINKEYLQHNYFTDIITFNYNVDNTISGDVFISLDTVANNAQEYGVTYLIELYRVIIHGVLHLIGFNDKTEEEQAIMTQKEDEALNILANNSL